MLVKSCTIKGTRELHMHVHIEQRLCYCAKQYWAGPISYDGSPKVGGVRTRATRAVAALIGVRGERVKWGLRV